MKHLHLIVVFAIAVSSANFAWAHGFLITAPGGKLTLTSEDPTAGGLPLYKVQSLLGPSTFKSADHPGYDVQSGITIGTSIGFNVLGPLWYSTGGGAPLHSPAGVDMDIVPQDILVPGAVVVTGDSGIQPGFLIGQYDGLSLGAFEHQLNYSLSVPTGVPIGAYAVALQLTGVDALGQPLTSSDPFVAVFNNGLPVNTLPAVAGQLYAAAIAVPEPSSIVLALLGMTAMACYGRRLRGTSKA
jgi:hypothetical protein